MASTFRAVTGPFFNHLTRMVVPGVSSVAPLALFPITNVYDNLSSRPVVVESPGTDLLLSFDLNILPNGGFTDQDDCDAWLGSEGTFTESSGEGILYGGEVAASRWMDILVRAGETLTFTSGSGTTGLVHLRNLQTGLWLQSNGSWSTSSYNHAGTSITFVMETVLECRADTVYLRVLLEVDGGSETYDDLYLWPAVNWISIHGHNIAPFLNVNVQRSTDNAAWNTEIGLTILRDSFYDVLSTLTSYRYWRIQLKGQVEVGKFLYLGEIVFGQYFTVLHNPNFGGSISWVDKQTRNETDIGDLYIQMHNQQPQRRLQMEYYFRDDAEYIQFRDHFFRRSRGGGIPLCIAPIDEDESVVLLGRIHEETTIVKTGPFPRGGELEVLELPLPNMGEVVGVDNAG